MRTVVPPCPDLTLTSSIMLSIKKTPRPFEQSTSGTDRGSDLRNVKPQPPSWTSTEASLRDTRAETRIG